MTVSDWQPKWHFGSKIWLRTAPEKHSSFSEMGLLCKEAKSHHHLFLLGQCPGSSVGVWPCRRPRTLCSIYKKTQTPRQNKSPEGQLPLTWRNPVFHFQHITARDYLIHRYIYILPKSNSLSKVVQQLLQRWCQYSPLKWVISSHRWCIDSEIGGDGECVLDLSTFFGAIWLPALSACYLAWVMEPWHGSLFRYSIWKSNSPDFWFLNRE